MEEMLKDLNGPWSNAACIGYCLIAMRRAGLRPTAQSRVLRVDEEGRLKCKAANQKATQIAPADVTANGKLPIVGAAVLMFQRGDELLGFTKHVADTICSEWLA